MSSSSPTLHSACSIIMLTSTLLSCTMVTFQKNWRNTEYQSLLRTTSHLLSLPSEQLSSRIGQKSEQPAASIRMSFFLRKSMRILLREYISSTLNSIRNSMRLNETIIRFLQDGYSTKLSDCVATVKAKYDVGRTRHYVW